MLQSLVAPVTITAASIWMFSSFCLSYNEQLSQTTLLYSRSGRLKAMYSFSSALRSITFSALIMLSRCNAFLEISSICICHFAFSENIIPKCLWLVTSFILILFKNKGGWLIVLVLVDTHNVSVLFGVKSTKHCFDQLWILLSRSSRYEPLKWDCQDK